VTTTVAISIISTGELDKVESCLRSIAAQKFDGSLHVLVVCNGPPDDSVAVRAIYPDATVIVNQSRMGFGENHDAALSQTDAEFCLALNPDVELNPDCVTQLVAAMRRYPRAGMVGPLLRYPDGSAQPSARRFPRVVGTIVRRTPIRRLFGAKMRDARHYLPDPTGDRRVDWFLGACLLMRTHVWRSLGGFDPEFRPLYVEDVDLAWRIWESGWEIWQIPSAEALHEHQAATDKVFLDRRTLWHLRGMIRFVRKHPRILFSGKPRIRPCIQ